MELSQHLQMVVNVIAIAGVTSLAAICYLLNRENEELSKKLNPPSHPAPCCATTGTERFPRLVSVLERSATVQNEPRDLPAPDAESLPDNEIRRFVNRRAHAWAAPSTAQWQTH
jgi:hypothetical protein